MIPQQWRTQIWSKKGAFKKKLIVLIINENFYFPKRRIEKKILNFVRKLKTEYSIKRIKKLWLKNHDFFDLFEIFFFIINIFYYIHKVLHKKSCNLYNKKQNKLNSGVRKNNNNFKKCKFGCGMKISSRIKDI